MKQLGLMLVLACPVAAEEPVLAEEEAAIEERVHDLAGIAGSEDGAVFIISPQGALVFNGGRGPGHPDMPLFGGVTPVERDVGKELEALLESLGAGLEIARVEKETGGRYRVEASTAAHAALASRIEALKNSGVPVTIECLIAPVTALDQAAPAWRSDGPFLGGEVFASALADPRSRLLSVSTRTGRSAFAAERGIEPVVASVEVNQTGVIPVGNPVVEVPLSGDRLEVRAALVPGSERIWIEAAAARIRVETRKQDMGPVLGEMDLPVFDETLASLGFLAPPGKTVVAAAHAGRGTVALLRVELAKANGVAGQAPAALDRFPRAYDLSPLLRAPAAPWPRDLVADGAGSSSARLSLAETLGLETQAGEDGTAVRVPGSGTVLLTAAADGHAAAERRLAESIRQAAEAFAIEIDLVVAERPLLAELRSSLADGVLGKEALLDDRRLRERRRYLVTGSAGRWHAVREASVGSYPSGAYLVAGGTGFGIMVAPLLDVATAGSGIEIRVRAERLPGADRLRLRVEGASARVTGERRVRLGTGFRGVEGGAPEPGVPATALPGYRSLPLFPGDPPGEVEPAEVPELLLPRQVVRYWNAEREVPEGRWAVLHMEADGETGSLVLARARAAR